MSKSWSVVDFVLVWLGGLLGAAVLFGLAAAIDQPGWEVLLSLGGQYAGSLLALWILGRRKTDPDIGFRIESGDIRYIGLGLILQIGVALLLYPLATLLFPDGAPPQEIADQISEANTLPLQVGLVLAAVVLGPVVEELMYRGVLLRALDRIGEWAAVLISSLVFMAVHIPGLSTTNFWRSAIFTLPPLFALGVILARLTQRKGRLGPAIFLHSGWNLVAALVLLIPVELLEQAT